MRQSFDSRMMQVLLGPIVAALQLFAAYVLVHGHYSPGGGFQAGVLLASAFILPLLVHGRHAARHGYLMLSQDRALALASLGVMIYTGIAVMPLLVGRPLLDYGALPLPVSTADRHSLGILGIEVGVTLAVAGAVVAIYRALQEHESIERRARRRR